VPYHVVDDSFEEPDAEQIYTMPAENGKSTDQELSNHMPDEVTRGYARQMHYAAYRMVQAVDAKRRQAWLERYYDCRDRIVLGNHKLIYRAVRRWMPSATLADDLIGDCQIVLIQAVAAYNPWLGIRFSTYAFTCLMRALSRLSQRHAADRLARSLPLDALPDGEPRDQASQELPSGGLPRIDEFLREGNPLLSSREKMVLMRRFSLDEQAKSGTLEQVGRELGLSKERVRQVQASALGKLRKALLAGAPNG
jgi:RNA polymerase primary sigma factor/RNA polymerase sigma factor